MTHIQKSKLCTFSPIYNEWNIQFPWILSIYQWNWIGKNEFSIGKNGILNLLEIMCITQNIWKILLDKLHLKVKVYVSNLLSAYNLFSLTLRTLTFSEH